MVEFGGVTWPAEESATPRKISRILDTKAFDGGIDERRRTLVVDFRGVSWPAEISATPRKVSRIWNTKALKGRIDEGRSIVGGGVWWRDLARGNSRDPAKNFAVKYNE